MAVCCPVAGGGPPPGPTPAARPPGPPPPPPPPPPPGYGTPWPSSFGPGWAAPGVPGQSTKAALRTIRDALQLYWISLVLSLLASLIASAALGEWYGGGLGVLSNAAASTSHPLVTGGAALLLGALVIVLLLAVLILTIVSWLRWRQGGDQLVAASAEFGPQAMQIAQHSRADVSRTTYMFVVIIVVAIGIAAAAVGVVLANVALPTANPNGTLTTHPIPAGVENQILGVVAVGAVLVAVFELLLYAFATRALVDAIAPYAPAPARARADSGRRYVMIGVLLSFAGAAAAFVPFVSLIGIVTSLLYVYGYLEMRGGFDAVLSQPIHFDPQAKPTDHFLAFV
jgi:hypothetical protein